MPTLEQTFPWPLPDPEVHAALQAVWADGSWGKYHGPQSAGLIAELRDQFACEQVLLCSSGTIGVELALRGCGVQPGEEVVLAGYDFAGNFRAVEALGARPVLVDVEPGSWSLSARALEEVSSESVRAVVVSHLHGGLADMRAIEALAQQRGWLVVNDVCQQPGAQLAGRPLASWGDVAVLSFGGSKLLTAGRGGAVLTDSAQIVQRMKVFAERGNWAFPLSELQAAVLRPQLAKLPERNARRAGNVATLLEATAGLQPWLRPLQPRLERQPETQPAYYKLPWSLLPAETEPNCRAELVARLQAAGVPVDVGFRGFTKRSARRCVQVGSLQQSARLSQSTLLLHHPILLAEKQTALEVAQVLDREVRHLFT
jgi:dTDP-4-amino-4,6-dideoxygalactose transaminase